MKQKLKKVKPGTININALNVGALNTGASETNFYERYTAVQLINPSVQAPRQVTSFLGPPSEMRGPRYLEYVMRDQVSFGEDFVSLNEAQAAVEWLVVQLGGSVTWQGSHDT